MSLIYRWRILVRCLGGSVCWMLTSIPRHPADHVVSLLALLTSAHPLDIFLLWHFYSILSLPVPGPAMSIRL